MSVEISGYLSEPLSNESIRIGDYLLYETIGKGTFGKVKLGIHLLTKQKVAVKVLEKRMIVNQVDVAAVKSEITILSHVRHPNISQLYEIIEDVKSLYFVMEYAENGELFDFIVRKRRLSELEACLVFAQLLNAVDYLHRSGICHRDLKPENLLFSYNFELKIIDFGLGKHIIQGETLSTCCGSPCYASPETVSSQPYDGKLVDLWSCGIILYAMICGFLPFDDDDQATLFSKITQCQFTIPEYVSQEAAEVIVGLLKKKPDERITIKEIINSQFYRTHMANAVVSSPSDIEVREDVISEVLRMYEGFSREQLVQSIKNNEKTPQTATYLFVIKRIQLKEETERSFFSQISTAESIALDFTTPNTCESATPVTSLLSSSPTELTTVSLIALENLQPVLGLSRVFEQERQNVENLAYDSDEQNDKKLKVSEQDNFEMRTLPNTSPFFQFSNLSNKLNAYNKSKITFNEIKDTIHALAKKLGVKKDQKNISKTITSQLPIQKNNWYCKETNCALTSPKSNDIQTPQSTSPIVQKHKYSVIKVSDPTLFITVNQKLDKNKTSNEIKTPKQKNQNHNQPVSSSLSPQPKTTTSLMQGRNCYSPQPSRIYPQKDSQIDRKISPIAIRQNLSELSVLQSQPRTNGLEKSNRFEVNFKQNKKDLSARRKTLGVSNQYQEYSMNQQKILIPKEKKDRCNSSEGTSTRKSQLKEKALPNPFLFAASARKSTRVVTSASMLEKEILPGVNDIQVVPIQTKASTYIEQKQQQQQLQQKVISTSSNGSIIQCSQRNMGFMDFLHNLSKNKATTSATHTHSNIIFNSQQSPNKTVDSQSLSQCPSQKNTCLSLSSHPTKRKSVQVIKFLNITSQIQSATNRPSTAITSTSCTSTTAHSLTQPEYANNTIPTAVFPSEGSTKQLKSQRRLELIFQNISSPKSLGIGKTSQIIINNSHAKHFLDLSKSQQYQQQQQQYQQQQQQSQQQQQPKYSQSQQQQQQQQKQQQQSQQQSAPLSYLKFLNRSINNKMTLIHMISPSRLQPSSKSTQLLTR